MPQLLDAADFFALHTAQPAMPLLDVRSPLEFAHGHMPHALSLPLFTDEERAAVGTAYAQQDAGAALITALRTLGPQLAEKVLCARTLCGGRKDILMHCWRGGMRSNAVAWLLEQDGFTVRLLRGGYKAYRALVRQDFQRPARLHLLTGMTGSGKTDILMAMRRLGAQVIDLEALASHRGSVFGNVGLPPQPSSEQCENNLHAQWAALDFSRPVWLEDESKRIGDVTICDEFFARMEEGRRFVVDVPTEGRVRRLTALYAAGGHDDALCHALDVLRKRLGGELHARCVQAVRAHEYADAVRLLLHYYDKVYRRSDEDARVAARLTCAEDDPAQAARELLRYDAQA